MDQPLYTTMRTQAANPPSDGGVLVQLARQLLTSLAVLVAHRVVHADLKPDNVLVIASDARVHLRLADFGSAYVEGAAAPSAVGTPEYMSPERLDSKVCSHPPLHAADIWSAGCLLLEVAVGVPLWIAYKTLVCRGETRVVTGLLAVPGRDASKILKRQKDLIPRLAPVLASSPGVKCPPLLVSLLQQLLALPPHQRPTPAAALEHAYLRERDEDGGREGADADEISLA